MAGYLVFLPGIHGAELTRRLQTVGLECLTDNVHTLECRDIVDHGGGPGGEFGQLVRWFDFHRPQTHTPLKYEPDRQEWIAAKPDLERGLAKGRYWLGRYKDMPITPDALSRPRQYASCGEKLLDGNEWLMPIAKALPQNLGLDDEGRLARVVKPSMRDYYDASEKFFHAYLTQDPNSDVWELEGCWSFAARGLGMNYYVNAAVIDWLGLLDDYTLHYLVGASFEYRKLLEFARELQKKTAATAA